MKLDYHATQVMVRHGRGTPIPYQQQHLLPSNADEHDALINAITQLDAACPILPDDLPDTADMLMLLVPIRHQEAEDAP